jgi:hypothetical protein
LKVSVKTKEVSVVIHTSSLVAVSLSSKPFPSLSFCFLRFALKLRVEGRGVRVEVRVESNELRVKSRR